MDFSYRRLYYLDNLKVSLIILVILGHISVTYGPVGFWYYYERTGGFSSYFLAFFTAFIQTFIIGLFLLIAAYFIPPSYSRKGPKLYIADRLKRLGIPLLCYILIVSPILVYVNEHIIGQGQANFLDFYINTIIRGGYFITGPLWFLQALLVFTLTYLVIRGIRENYFNKSLKNIKLGFPSNFSIFIFIIIIAAASFGLRIWFPIGSTAGNLQLSFVPQYLAMFVIGILAFHNQWLKKLEAKKAILWSAIALAAVPFWPAIINYNQGFEHMAPAAGGLSWQSLCYSIWEALVGVGLTMGLIYFFKMRFNFRGRIIKWMAHNAYATFVVHPLIIVPLTYLIRDLGIDSLLKFLIIGLVGIPLCFTAGMLLKKIPGAKTIL